MLLDTSAWIEYFIGSEKGRKVESALAEKKCYTSLLSMAEISQWASRKGSEPKQFIDILESISEILPVSKDICTLAGELNHKRKQKVRKWGLMDSFILSTSLIYGLAILTADSDFRDLNNCIPL